MSHNGEPRSVYPSLDSKQQSLADPPSSSPQMADALLSSTTKMVYNGGAVPKQSDDDRSSILSGFYTTAPGSKSRRKSSITQGSASPLSSTINLVNTVIGAGILGLPETFTHTGWALGIALLIAFAICSIFTFHLQMIAAHTLKASNHHIRISYLTMCNHTIPRLRYLVDITLAVTCFGICLAYLVVVGDLMPDVLAQIIDKPDDERNDLEQILESRQFWIIVFLCLFIIPTVRLRNLDNLRFTSSAAIVCFAYVTTIVVLYAFVDALDLCDESDSDRFTLYCENTTIDPIPIHSATDALRFFKAAPVVIFAFGAQQNAFSVSNELEVASKSNLNKVAATAMTFCCIIYMIVAFSGYYSFGESAPSNLLVAYPRTTPFLIVRVCLSLAVSFSYPVLNHPGRNSISSLMFNVEDATKLDWIKYHLITWTVVVATFVIAMITDDLGLIFGLVGATGTTTIAFILPGLFYYYLPDKMLEYNGERNYRMKKYLAMCMVVLGIVLIPFCVAMQFVSV